MVFTLTFSYNFTDVTGRSRLLTIITLSPDCRCGALKRRTAAKLEDISRILPYVIIIVFIQQFLTGCVITTPNKSFNNLDSVVEYYSMFLLHCRVFLL